MLFRAYSVVSSYEYLHTEFCFLINYFYKNGFPKQLVQSCINKFLDNKFNFRNKDNNLDVKKMYFSLPFFGHQSEKYKKELLLLFKRYFTSVDFNIVLSNSYKIGNFFQF